MKRIHKGVAGRVTCRYAVEVNLVNTVQLAIMQFNSGINTIMTFTQSCIWVKLLYPASVHAPEGGGTATLLDGLDP